MKNIGKQLSSNEIKNVDVLSAIEMDSGSDFSSLSDNINEIWNKVYVEQSKTISELKTKIAFIWGSVLATKKINSVREQQIIILQKNIKDILKDLDSIDYHLDIRASFNSVDYEVSRLRDQIKQELVKIKKSIQDIKSNKEATQDNSR